MAAKKNDKIRYNVGGQAVIEGVMLRSPHFYGVAVRRMNGKIVTDHGEINSAGNRYPVLKAPFLRGILSLIESFTLSFSTLDFSSKIAIKDEEEREKKRAKKTGKKLKKKSKKRIELEEKITSFFIYLFAFAIAGLLFVYAPIKSGEALRTKVELFNDRALFNLFVVSFRLLLFFLYIWGISFMDDIKRLFQYHGAEHKTIYAFEDGKKVTYASVKKYRTQHPRCGTAFMFITFMISLFFFILFLPPGLPIWKRILIEIPLVLPIAGISYEILRLSAKHKDNILIRIFTAPGIWFQNITTKEPDKKQVEVAIHALNLVLKLESKYRPKAAKK